MSKLTKILLKNQRHCFASPVEHTFVTVMKSGPKNMLFTPSILKSCWAKTDGLDERGLGKSLVLPLDMTGTPGMNLRLFGLGVS